MSHADLSCLIVDKEAESKGDKVFGRLVGDKDFGYYVTIRVDRIARDTAYDKDNTEKDEPMQRRAAVFRYFIAYGSLLTHQTGTRDEC